MAAEIATAAIDLFLEQGFDATTIDQVAARAGVSRRSLFRYFGTKEDIVLGNGAELGRTVRDALAQRPADEGPWEALRAAFDVIVQAPDYSARRSFELGRMCLETPSLRARQLEKRLQWLDVLVPAVQARLPVADGDPGLRARAVVAAALACLDVATEAWVQRNGEGHLDALYDDAVGAVRGLP